MSLGFVIDNSNLMAQWNWEKNNKLGFYPDKLTLGSNKKVWWKCDKCNYEWQANSNNRSKGQGCPVCANKILVKGKNDLKTLYPEIAKKWHPTLNEKKADEVFSHSSLMAWWICEKDERHVFQAKVSHLTEDRIICPVCSNQKIIVGVNDLETTHSELLKEWDFEKNDLLPTQVTYGKNTKVWWKCEKGHGWRATIASRCGTQKTGCPECKKELRVSLPEKALVFYLSRIFQVEENKRFSFLGSKEIDLFLPELKLGIEYDGQQWHKNVGRDVCKDEMCKKNGLSLLRIREQECPDYTTTAYVVKVPVFGDKVLQLKELIRMVFVFLNETFNTQLDPFPDVQKDFLEIESKALTLNKEKSVANSRLIVEWNDEKNGSLDPRLLSLGSQKKVWWKCVAKGHEWIAAIYSRASGVNCPYCSNKKLLVGYNDLKTVDPLLAEEWDYEKNELKPEEVITGSNKKFWWICSVCGNGWIAAVSQRMFRNRGCPKCGRRKTISSHFKRIVNLDNGKEYENIKQAAQETGAHPSAISNCCRGITKSAGGYHWRFVENKEKD